MALGAGKGDAIFVPAFTFAATAEIAPLLGATPYFVDVDPNTFNMGSASLKRSVLDAKARGLRPFCVIPVDLFGLPADYDNIIATARESGMRVVGDSAQAFGAVYNNRRIGSIADVTTTSFFPAKPLGCYGDGGALFTDDDELAATIDSLRIHGKGTDKYQNVRIGLNSRLDTLQAAILIEKLKIYDDEIIARQKVAARYDDMLSDRFETPHVPSGLQSVWAQYTLKLGGTAERKEVQEAARQAGVPTVVYYPLPLHHQPAYRDFPSDPDGLKISESLCENVLSLPMHPYLAEDVQNLIVESLTASR